MKRQEEIENAAKMKYPYEGGVKGDICQASIPIFVEGAKWADNNPSQQALAKELHRLGYGITLNGDIISKDEENKEMERYVEYQKEKFIEKACEWLKENIYHRVYECGDKLGFPTADFIEDFKKAMEE